MTEETLDAMLERLGEIEKRRGSLLSQLTRQIAFHRKHGIQPQEIRAITLIGAGTPVRSRIEMRGGEVYSVAGDAQAELDGTPCTKCLRPL